MANYTYHWIQDDGPHHFARIRKSRHHMEKIFKYFMLDSYSAQATRGLHVNSLCGLTSRHTLSHKEKGEIHRAFIYEPLQALNFQKKPMEFLKFQQGDTPKIRVWSTSAKDMLQKQRQERHLKSDILSAIRL